ncbi:MAG: hypothetical protein DI551_00560 [Micavibrio aeruginosavorus]|uniref:diguanylate cyclase n=1 Tax=Micavibrio aeruginosavorus TaxID=349221 RepID=A0A2W5N8K5_9BACT|nr:MAG: hypothetical protein DI551_00560 [Micavibrio aeruginosavorus]
MMSFKRRIDIGFFVAFVLILSVGASVYANFRQMNIEKQRVDHTYEVMDALQNAISYLKDVQGASRGYVITGLEEYLAPYYIALPKVDENIETLEVLISDNPEQIKRSKLLHALVDARMAIAEQTVDTYKKEGQAKAFAMIKSGAGKREMDEIRVIVAEMINTEQNLLNLRKTATATSSRLTLIAGSFGIVVCITILAAVFSLIHGEARRRERTESSLRDAFKEMERISQETQLVGNLGDYLRGCRSDQEAYHIITNNMPQIFPGTSGTIAIFNNSRNLLQTVLRWGELPGVIQEFEPDSCWALRQGRMHYYMGDKKIPMCEHIHNIDESNYTICLPMQAQGQTIGQLFIAGHNFKDLGDSQILRVRSVGEQVSLALANIYLQRALKEQSIKDPLTRLFNRRYLEETLAREFARSQRNEKPLSVLIMDIDFFKKVNDTYGHEAGDEVLIAFANMLQTKIRKEDIACRLGGEEFVLVMPEMSLERAAERAEDICATARKLAIKFQKHTISVTVSIGVAEFPIHGQATDELLHNADLCLYKAKREGRDRVVVYDPEAITEKIGSV